MKNIETFNHEILGEMHVFGDENGLWFSLYDVAEKLDIAISTASFKFKHLSKDLKQCVDCIIEKYDSNIQSHRFIQEKVVYQLMCIGDSPYCDEFRKWVGDIAYEYDYLNIRCNDSQLGMYGNVQTNYNIVKEYVSRVNDNSPIGIAVKNAMNELDESFNDKWISDNIKPVICDKSYRTDYTLEEVFNIPDFNPSIFKEDEKEFKWEDVCDNTDDSVYEFIMNYNDNHEVEINDENASLLIDDYDPNPTIMKKKEGYQRNTNKHSCWIRTEIK